MKDSWTDFEKYAFEKLEKIERRLSVLEGKWIVVAGISAVVGVAVAEFLLGVR